MSSPLRAFLMFFPAEGTPTNGVFSDLGNIVEAWAKNNDQYAGSVLHIGFERIAPRHFLNVARKFPGKLLVTSGAKFALPRGYTATESPVGFVFEEPVFLALSGWGYSVDGSEVESAEIPGVASISRVPSQTDYSTTAKKRVIWLDGYLSIYPDEEEKIDKVGIFDEDSYLEYESQLPIGIRKSLGQFRFNHLILGNSNDPCAFARFAPPWLKERSFDTLKLTVRLANVFEQEGLKVVADLADWKLAELERLRNFGRKSVRDLLEVLNQGLADGPFSQEALIELEAETNFLVSLIKSIGKLEERERDILEKRMGLSAAPKTLNQIGEEYGVSRERIRQVESKAVKKIIAQELWDDLFVRKLSKQLEERDFPMSIAGLENVDDWFSGVSEKRSVFEYWLKAMPGLEAYVVEIEEIQYLAPFDQEDWETMVRDARNLLKSGVGLAWTFEQSQQFVQSLLGVKGREFGDLLWKASSSLCHFQETSNGTVLQSFGRGAEQLILAVLEQSSVPLHFSEIPELVQKASGSEMDVRRAQSAVGNVGILLGRGTYGLRKHINLSDDDFVYLGDIAEEVIQSGLPERQWHSSELLAIISENLGPRFSDVDQYIVSASLKDRDNVDDLGRLVWRQKTSASSSDRSRIDIRQALISILQDAGHPLHSTELRKRLNRVRGTNSFFQIVPSDPLIRVGTSIWGINDRDVLVKRDSQDQMIEYAIEELSSLGHGIHVSETSKFLPKIPKMDPEAIFSLLLLSPKIQNSVGRYLYLSEWGEARRLSVPEALDKVLQESEGGCSLDYLHFWVSEKMQRDCDRTAVSGALQNSGASVDENGYWSL